MTSDRHDDRRREGGAADPDGQGGQPMPKSGRDTQLREELRARMRAIEAGNAAPKSPLGPAVPRTQLLSSPDEAADVDGARLLERRGAEVLFGQDDKTALLVFEPLDQLVPCHGLSFTGADPLELYR